MEVVWKKKLSQETDQQSKKQVEESKAKQLI